MTAKHSRTVVYVSCDTGQKIVHFNLDAAGVLTRSGTTAIPQGDGGEVVPVTDLKSLRTTGAPLAISPGGEFVYASVRTTPFRLASFRIDRCDGTLTLCGEVPLPASTPYIGTDRSGRYVLGAAYNGNMLWVGRTDGMHLAIVQAVEQVITPHYILANAANDIVYVAATGHPEIQVYDFDVATGTLANVRSTPYAGSDEATPRHLELHPARPWLYAINETLGTVDAFAVAAGTGALTHFQRLSAGLADELAAPLLGADLHLSPDGRFLFASERRFSKLSVFAIDRDTGRLTLVQRIQAGAIPRSFQIDPSGSFLIAAGQATSEITVFAIDGATGRLDQLATYETGPRPTSIEIVSLG